MQIGTEQYRKTVDGLTKLVDRANDSEKIKADREDKAVRREMDGEAEREQLKEAKKKRQLDFTAELIKVGVPAVLAIWGTAFTLRYEDRGVFPTTIAGKEMMNKLFRRK